VNASRPQYVALPCRRADAGIEIMLATSRETARWVIRKAGRSPD